ncbi:hypothetical protein PSHT_07291 [Puccinia striiformis]|uniref:RING-type domain-containing protein n=1 Tax=Puccinia striiformis TaxID=27350 RepID=A0A2S4VZD9_9BASI|nr:hypothetical protein PSHT_07291 [Puccinia striiformis]
MLKARHEVVTQFETEGRASSGKSIRSDSIQDIYHVQGNPHTLEILSPPQVDSIQLRETCVICLDTLETGHLSLILTCQHFFHTHYIDEWSEKLHTSCPSSCHKSQAFTLSAYERSRMLMCKHCHASYNTDGAHSGFITFITSDACDIILDQTLDLGTLAFVIMIMFRILDHVM